MTGDRIVGGEAASSPIPWQVSVRQGQSGLFVCLFIYLFVCLFVYIFVYFTTPKNQDGVTFVVVPFWMPKL
jgi:hypothetical protein